jgi:uncharacterized protein YjiS (DUF1127 family)
MCDAQPWGAGASPAHVRTCAARDASRGLRRAWSLARARWRHRPGRVGIVGGLRRLAFVLDLALEVRRERRTLLGMTDHALRDMGLSRNDAYAEAHRSLWDIPRERMYL